MNKVKNAVALMSFCVGTLYSSVLLAQSTEEVGSDLTRSDQVITIERAHASPSLNGSTLIKPQYSPDGSRITYLKGRSDNKSHYDLWEYVVADNSHQLLVNADDLVADTTQLSDEEKARRERQREYGSGIMSYQFSNNGQAVLFPLAGNIFHYDIPSKTVKQLTNNAAFDTDVKFSPTGKFVSFIRNQNLVIVEVSSGKEKRLTQDGGGTLKYGMAEFVAQEEMGRMTGYWWSPSEKHIAFMRVDESPVDVITRNEIYADDIKLIEQRYPRAGTNNARVDLATINLKTDKVRYLELDKSVEYYLPRLKWTPDGQKFAYQWQSRDHKNLSLVLYDTKKRKQKTLLTEQSSAWINLHDDLHFLRGNRGFIWASERSGYKHLYRYDMNGNLRAQLTKGEWIVDQLEGVDEKNNWVYFTGRADTPLEKHLYKVPLDGKSPEHVVRVSKRHGWHDVAFSRNNLSYLDTYSNHSTPAQMSLHDISGERKAWLAENAVNDQHPFAPYQPSFIVPEYGSITAADNTTALYYKLYKPKDFKLGKNYPAVVYVYGGPHAQRVTNQWKGVDIAQLLAQSGYVVFQLDNRGSNYRGTAFEFPLYKKLGDVELQDQIAGAKFLQSLAYVDKDNIGIYGHSYGGYMAIMAMFKASDVFSAGVSGAPVTDWSLYDTYYTEKYLAHPAENAQGYEQSSVFPYIDTYNGDLLIYHGMADDNVLFTHTTKLAKALQQQGKLFELMTYPGSKHSMRGEKVKVHLHRTIVDFFGRKLKQEKPEQSEK